MENNEQQFCSDCGCFGVKQGKCENCSSHDDLRTNFTEKNETKDTNTKWIEIQSRTRTFHLLSEPELIHIIKTGFKDKYMVVYEDAYELNLGNLTFCTKEEIENRFKIKL